MRLEQAPDPKALLGTFWVTRDIYEGSLCEYVEVWLVAPDRLGFADGDVMWVAPVGIVDRATTYAGRWSIEQAVKELPGYPTDSRQCVRSG